MQSFLADYDPIFSYLNTTSNAVSDEDYRKHIPISTQAERLDYARIEYGRLFEEIEFLVRHWDPEAVPKPVLVVQGAYPAAHYILLTQLFPTLTIHLWSSSPVLEMYAVSNSERIQFVNNDLTEPTCLEQYRDKEIFFVCYCELNAGIETREGIYQEYWNTEMTYQYKLITAMNPIQSSLTFCLPVVGADELTYYRGYITPCCLTTKGDSIDDRLCRCIPIKQDGMLVRCNYPIDWYSQTLNYWNLAAKKGRLLRNSLDSSSFTQTNTGVMFLGIELCRIIDILHSYRSFSQQVDPQSTGSVNLQQIMVLLHAINTSFRSVKVDFSLVEYSNRYKPADHIEQTESNLPVGSVAQPEELGRALAMLLMPEETLVDLTL